MEISEIREGGIAATSTKGNSGGVGVSVSSPLPYFSAVIVHLEQENALPHSEGPWGLMYSESGYKISQAFSLGSHLSNFLPNYLLTHIDVQLRICKLNLMWKTATV